jgi:4-amino-4-deoxy-L-arabinose transferase-like glycosyltransferase
VGDLLTNRNISKPSAGWQSDRAIDLLWFGGFSLAAILLFTLQLGNLPLRDWDEGIAAQVAREMGRSLAADPDSAPNWLYPQYLGGPYYNKPPLMHWLMALAYGWGGVNEWTARLPGALLAAISVPCLYGLGRELFFRRAPAVLATAVYLTELPVVRQGRLAMLEGAMLCWFVLTLISVLRARRDLRWSAGIGMGIGLMCLTKGILGLLLGAIALIFLGWDTPRLLSCGYLWLGLGLGAVPVVGWYGAQWLHYGAAFWQSHLLDQSLNRVWSAVERHHQPVGYYLLELLKYGLPWLLFLPSGLVWTWRQRSTSWSKLLLLWFGLYLGVISLMGTKLPWYLMPLYPAVALIVGVQLDRLWSCQSIVAPGDLPRRWALAWGLLTLVCGGALVYFVKIDQQDVAWVCAALAGTFGVATGLVLRRRSAIPVLLWGSYVAMLLFVSSSHWIWELAEDFDVRPVAALARQAPADRPVWIEHYTSRPSLEFYADRRVSPYPMATMQQQMGKVGAFVLVRSDDLRSVGDHRVAQLANAKVVATEAGWTLVTGATKAAAPTSESGSSGTAQ